MPSASRLSGGSLEKQHGNPDFLTHRVHLAERLHLLRNLHPAAGAGNTALAAPHGCGKAARQRQRRRRFHMLRHSVGNGGGPDARHCSPIPLGRAAYHVAAAPAAFLPFPPRSGRTQMTPWADCALRQLPIRLSRLRCPALGAVRLAPGVGLRRSARPWANCARRQPTTGVLRGVGVARPREWCVRHEATTGVPGASGGYLGHGNNGNGRQIDDNYDSDDQEVNDTNTDPVSPIATGRLEEGMNRR